MIEYNAGTIDICGEALPSEVLYENEDGRISIEQVIVLRKTCKENGVWYDESGKAQPGPTWVQLDITSVLSDAQKRAIADEIEAYNAWLWAECQAE